MKPEGSHFSSYYGLVLLTLLLLPLVIALGLAFRQKFLEWFRGSGSQQEKTW